MKIRQTLLILLLMASVQTDALAQSYAYSPESSLLPPPPGLESPGDGHGDIAVSADGNIYVSVQGGDLAGVQVYDGSGHYLRNLPGVASDYHGFRIHRDADGREYLYAIEMNGGRLLKLDLEGGVKLALQVDELVPSALQARRFLFKGVRLTGVAVASNGLIFVADGYASSRIHVFDAEGTYSHSIGGEDAPYGFATAHKILVDTRFEPERLLVTDRENRRLVWLDFEGNILDVKSGFRRPSALALYGDVLAVGELEGRVVLLDRDGNIRTQIGSNDNPEQIATPKVAPEEWHKTLLTSPHGVAFDKSGDLLVTEWNRWGRILRFQREAD